MRGLETDHVISGPMRGLEKKPHGEGADRHTDGRTDGHRDSMTDPAQRAESVKIFYVANISHSLFAQQSPVHWEAGFPGGDNHKRTLRLTY